jgi:hypothetical protein
MKMNEGHWLNDTDREHGRTGRKTFPRATLSTTDLTLPGLELSQILRSKRPETKGLKVDTNLDP